MRIVSVVTCALLLGMVGSAGCQGAPPVQSTVEGGTLTVEYGADSITGSYQSDAGSVHFGASTDAASVTDIAVSMNGKDLTARIDFGEDSLRVDVTGKRASDGAQTHLELEEAALLGEVSKALAGGRYAADSDLESTLVRAISVWALHSPTATLQQTIEAEPTRSIQYLCHKLERATVATDHSDSCQAQPTANAVDIGPDANVCFTNLGNCGSRSGSMQYGSDYGRCNTGFANDHIYTADCLEYDHCIRNHDEINYPLPHNTMYCDPILSKLWDDFFIAGDCPDPVPTATCDGNEGQYVSEGSCWCDASCDAHGDCCADKWFYVDYTGPSCEGNCDGFPGSGCYCDEWCEGYGDCCPDKRAECG